MHQSFEIYTKPQTHIDWLIESIRDRNYDYWLNQPILQYCGETEAGQFSKRLISLMKMVMRRQGLTKKDFV